ncbi:MAG TPA: BTAD domain-containing putative transcriptional regulator, partial [Solirubrobacteraceae bacterium]|nr:BTAD domain-containing putative transcriptional regulator [Solirubrobacteraceae bacterium]
MRVRLFGPVSASVGDNEVRLGGRQQRAVFALLALQANQAVALDRLAHEVWRDEPPARSTLSLQSYISRLRRSIAEAHSDASLDGAPPQLVTRPPGWALLTPRESVDALHFVDLVAEGHQLIDSTDIIAGSARLREALSLWSAEPFADLDDLPSAREASARLQGLRLDAVEVLFSVDLSAGRAALVADQARRFVEENPYRERGWGALMVALYRQGRQAEALSAAHQLRVALADGLGIDPSPESRALQEQILRQDPALALPLHPNTEAADGGQGGPGGLAAGVGQADAPFVGRGFVLAALDRVVRSSRDGQGGLLVIEGPPGMGKSAVLNEFSQRMLHGGGSVVHGAGAATGATPALWPWMSIVRQVAAASPHLLQGSGETGAAGALALLDPSVGVGGGARTAWGDSDPGLARTRLYRAIVDLLSLAHRANPLAIVLDDLQWADEDTTALLALAADELVPQGVLLVVALRSGEAPRLQAEIGTLVARHRRQSARLELDGLGVDDVLAIIRRAAPDHEELEVAEAIRLRTGGNPLFITELVQLLVSERRLDEQSVYDVLPSSVRDVLKRRLDRLPDRTRLLLAFLALFDRAVDARLLAEVAGTTEDSTLDDCEAAVASSLLLDGGVGGFLLSHDLVRQTLEETISFSRKARMHARIASALLPTGSGAAALLPEAMAEIAH